MGITSSGLLKDLGLSDLKHVSDESPIIVVSGNEVFLMIL